MRLLFWIAIFGFLYWYFFKRKKRISNSARRKTQVTELVLDENCGTYIPKKNAIRVEIDGKVYYFCSEKCLEDFMTKRHRGDGGSAKEKGGV